MTMTTMAARVFITQHLGEIIAQFPPEVQDVLYDKFLDAYAHPMTSQLELVLRKRLTDEEVRHLLFAPSSDQYRHYATLLSLKSTSTADDPDTAWPATLQKRFLALFYLKHVQNWPLTVEFILQDGLQILVDLFLHEDLQVRGQAIDCFVQVTSQSAFDWFEAPVGYNAMVLHAKMIALSTGESGFLRSIISNIRLYESQADKEPMTKLPGGTYVLLQVLAFYLSWVRRLYTEGALRLSRELLELLHDWQTRTETDNDAEMELARRVYEDFSRWPPLEDAEEEEREGRVLELPTSNKPRVDFFTVSSVQRLVEEAQATPNASAASQALERAIDLCTASIDAESSVVDACLWRAKALAVRLGQEQDAGRSLSKSDVDECLDDCKQVLAVDPLHMEAWRCQLDVLKRAKRWVEGLDTLRAANEASRLDHFLPVDQEYLKAQLDLFRHHSQTIKSQEEKLKELDRARTSRQEEIYQLLLRQRHPNAPAEPPETDPAHVASTEKTKDAPSSATVSSPDPLARFRASAKSEKKRSAKPTVATDSSLEPLVRGRAFARKFHQLRSNRSAQRAFVLSSELSGIQAASESTLSNESLVEILELMVQAHGDDESLQPRRLAVLDLLVNLSRLRLFCDVAEEETQSTINSNLATAEQILVAHKTSAEAA
ncbi:hypothetical protein Poli38472_014742 [Pythium oligandrum]|uniref:Uncharacterized protein n=1 Tax=Pythium oligandrum TaxID=41045 RepID=A0A8K1C1Z4_PYTOL|nr:hypothetical protein Poli38472_014742 [Pythium oligandrum]|eukprot:TMW54971.1 hypothetical protein Poli38472_014742 [Pythium oligandrum]